MAEEQLRKAYGLMKQGQTKESLAIVQSVLKEDKNNVAAWWMMTNLLSDDPQRQRKALEKTLALDPKHKLALQMQAKLDGVPAPKSSPQPKREDYNSTQEMMVDWGKLEARDAGKKTVDEDKASNVTKMVNYMMIGFVLLIVVVIGGLWAFNTYQSSVINTPQAKILAFYNSVLRGDTAAARAIVCPDAQAAFDSLAPIITQGSDALKAQMGEGASITYDFSGLTADVVTQDATSATVRVAGQISLSAPQLAEPLTHTVEATDANLDELRLENGVWCVAKVQ
jgi:hypothetical protein